MRLSCLFLLVLGLCVIGSNAYAQQGDGTLCAEIKPFETRINITYETVPPVYDFSKTEKQLTKDAAKTTKEWLDKNGMEVLWTADDMSTAGLASGGYALAGNHYLRSKNVDSIGAYHCAFFAEVNLAVFYRTIIYIPKDYPQGSCKFNIIHKHEFRHHKTNQDMVDKYVSKLEQDVRKMIPYMEGEYLGSDKVERRFEDMKTGLSDAIKVYLYEAMSEETAKLNGEIDTPEEYKNTGKLFQLCDIRDAYYKKHGRKTDDR